MPRAAHPVLLASLLLPCCLALVPDTLRAQGRPIKPLAQQCGNSPGNPCRPGIYLPGGVPAAMTLSPESGPYAATIQISNNGGVGGTYEVTCPTGSGQLACSSSPSDFHLDIGAAQTVTLNLTTLGLGTFGYTVAITAEPDEGPGYEGPSFASYPAGPVTVAGMAMISHLVPPDNGTLNTADTLRAAYWHASGITLSSVRLLLNGNDSSSALVKTSTGYTSPALHPSTGYHTWTSYACAGNGRCDSVHTTFDAVAAISWALDDSLPPTASPLNDGGTLLGPVHLPPVALRGCAVATGDPEISFTAPKSFLIQSTPSGRVFVAVIDTSTTTVRIATQTLAWILNKSRRCDELSFVPREQFDYSYFPARSPDDPLWLSYPWLSSAPPASDPGAELWGDSFELALAERPRGGPRAPVVPVWQAWRDLTAQPARKPGRVSSRALLPDPGPIDSLSWHVELNGVAIIHNSAAVSGSGVTGIVPGRLFQEARLPVTHPAFTPVSSGGWNELVASISDTLGHTTTIRTRFVAVGAIPPGSPAAVAITPQRNFTHQDQGECAAFGAFQCDGVVLASALPGFVTRDRERSLHLVYRSASQKTPFPVPLELFVTRTQKAPDSLWVIPLRNGVADSARITRYAGVLGAVTGTNATNLSEDQDERRIVAAEVDSAPGDVNIRRVAYVVRSWFRPGYGVTFRDDSVSQDVVQASLMTQSATRFGQGWQLAEVGRLVFTGPSGGLRFQGDTAAVWLAGDGSYSVFRKPGASWLSPPGETTRLVRLASLDAGARYVLYPDNGASIGFRDDGWQVWTRDLVGNATTYSYQSTSSNQLNSIADPTGKAMVFIHFVGGKRDGFVRELRLRRSGTASDTITVATFAYDTVTNPVVPRLAKIRVIRGPLATDADSTRFTYHAGALYGAFLDSLVDPRHTTAKPVVTRFSYDPALWTPVGVTRPLGGTAEMRFAWRRAAPRNGYGRRVAGNALERMVQSVQWTGTWLPFAGPPTDYLVDRFGGPTYVRNNASLPELLGTASADVRHIVRDTVGRPLRIVHNRYEPAQADSVIYHYDALGRVDTLIRSTRRDSLGAAGPALDTLRFTWDSVTLAANAAWCSRLKTAVDAMGGVTQAIYPTGVSKAACLPIKLIGLASDTTIFTYGPLTAGHVAGVRPVTVRDPNGLRDSVAYHAGTWNSEYLVRMDTVITRAYYDALGRPDSIRDPVGKLAEFRRDRLGRVTSARVGSGSLAPATRTGYDPGGLVIRTDVYAPSGGDWTVVPGSAQTTWNYFDPLARLDSVVHPGGRSISPTGFQARKQSWTVRDGFGNPRWDFAGNGTWQSRVYDAQGRVTQLDQGPAWNGASLDGERAADNATVAWRTSLALPMGKAQHDGATHRYGYDNKGRLVTTASGSPFLGDSSYVNRSYEYTRPGQLRRETSFFNDGTDATVVRRYGSNRRGQRILALDSVTASGVTTERVGETRYYYSAATARLDSVIAKVDGTIFTKVSFTWDRGGREVQRKVRPSASPTGFELITTTTYNVLGEVATISTVKSTGGTAYSLSGTTYTKLGDLTAATAVEPGMTTGSHTYTYSTDGTRRLLTATEGGLGTTYTYDVYGNRSTELTAETVGEPSRCLSTYNLVYEADSRLVSRLPTVLTTGCVRRRYWTDQAGQRLGESDTTYASPVLGLRALMTYTAGGELYIAAAPSGVSGTYDFTWHWYDAEGRRVRSQISTGLSQLTPWPHPDSVGGFKTYYVYDGSDVALELVRSATGWRVDRRFVSGGLDRPLAGRFWLTAGYQSYALVSDRSGSVREAYRPDGTVETNAAYFARDAFGALAGVTGSGGAPLGGVGFTGAGTPTARGGFVYLRNRWYDPSTGRFLTQDPIGLAGGVNLYAYAGNNPIAFSDPFGLCPWHDIECWQDKMWAASGGTGVAGRVLAPLASTAFELSGASGVDRSAREAAGGSKLAIAALIFDIGSNAIPGGGEAVQGTKAAVRSGLKSLGLADDVAKGVRGVLGSGRGEQWGVEAMKEGGAMVHRFVKGGDGKSSAIYTYVVDKAGKVAGTIQRAFDEAGNLTHFDPK